MNALMLANALEVSDKHPELINVNNRAASELRRLHEVNVDLLEALKKAAQQLETDAIFMSLSGASGNHQAEAALVARAAIAKATGETK